METTQALVSHFGFIWANQPNGYSDFTNGMSMIQIQNTTGIKKSDSGLAALSQWDLVSNKQVIREEQPLQIPLPLKIDQGFTMIIVKEKPDVTNNDVGGYVRSKVRRSER
ncbi:hypothetical protein BC332_18743 [Capsicum chinense]|nr:hypothetical protein BC332_18743 [Capsicum chinense]